MPVSKSGGIRVNGGVTTRSIEEIILKRSVSSSRIDSSDPSSWPDPNNKKGIVTQSLPRLQSVQSEMVKSVSFNTGVKTMGIANNQTLSSQDKDGLIETLTQYCRNLQFKVEDLENKLHGTILSIAMKKEAAKVQHQNHLHQQEEMHKSHVKHPPSPKKLKSGRNQASISNSDNHSIVTMNSNLEEGDIKSSMGDIDLKVMQLKELFRNGNPMEERHKAATTITSTVRAYLCRVRYKYYLAGSKEWRLSRCRHLIWVMDILLNGQAKLDGSLLEIKMRKDMKAMYLVFTKWYQMIKQFVTIRRATRQAAENKFNIKREKWILKVWIAFKSVCVGKNSLKNANNERRILLDTIRVELSEALRAKGEIGIVPEWEVQRMLNKRVILNFMKKKNVILMRFLWSGLTKNVYMIKRNAIKSSHHWLKVIAGKCFYAWSDHVYMVGVGIDRKKWKGPRKYEIRYNQKRVDFFSRRRGLSYVMGPWIAYSKVRQMVKFLAQRSLARFVQYNFHAFVAQVKKQRKLRSETISNWKGYSREISYVPFAAWASYVKAAKNSQNEKTRLVSAYVRWKWRQKMLLIMRTWRHQALYGRIDGMYTRKMLVKSLAEQKQHSTGIERLMANLTVELEECRELVEREILKRKVLEDNLNISNQEISRNIMISHHIEQELRRTEAIIESMTIINPRQIAHLKMLQPSFKFKDRKITIIDENAEKDKGSEFEKKPEVVAPPIKDKEKLKEEDENNNDEDEDGDEDNEQKDNETEEEVVNDDSSIADTLQSPAPIDSSNVDQSAIQKTDLATPVKDVEGSVPVISPNESIIESIVPLKESDAIIPSVYPSTLSIEDQILLDRARWLVKRMRPDSSITMPRDIEPEIVPQVSTKNVSSNDSIDSSIIFNSKSVDVELEGLDVASREAILPRTIALPYTGKGSLEDRNHEIDDSSTDPENAAHILISVIDFLLDGDVTMMHPDDRREWTKTILTSVRESSDGPVDPSATISKNLQVDITNATEIVESRSWRSSLLILRSLHPGAGNYSGVGKELDVESSGIYKRIIEMRENMFDVIKIQEVRHNRRIQNKIKRIEEEEKRQQSINDALSIVSNEDGDEIDEEDEREDDDNNDEDYNEVDDNGEEDNEYKPMNVYSSNLKTMLKFKGDKVNNDDDDDQEEEEEGND